LWIFSSSIPGTTRFRAETPDGAPPEGEVELATRRWFSWTRTKHPLAARNVFEKGFADSDYRVYVTPNTDCRIEFDTRHMRAELYFKILAGILILGVIAGTAAFLFAPGQG